MLYYKVMKQLKTYRVNTVFTESLEFGEFCELGCIRTLCISINHIHSTPYEILCLINILPSNP